MIIRYCVRHCTSRAKHYSLRLAKSFLVSGFFGFIFYYKSVNNTVCCGGYHGDRKIHLASHPSINSDAYL